MAVVRVRDPLGTYPIKSGVTVNDGDLVGLDSNGQVVLADADANIEALGVAWFGGQEMGRTQRTGVAALTERCPIYREAVLNGYSSLTIGAPGYLSTTAGSITATSPSGTAGSLLQQVATAIASDTWSVRITNAGAIKAQTAATSVIAAR